MLWRSADIRNRSSLSDDKNSRYANFTFLMNKMYQNNFFFVDTVGISDKAGILYRKHLEKRLHLCNILQIDALCNAVLE